MSLPLNFLFECAIVGKSRDLIQVKKKFRASDLCIFVAILIVLVIGAGAFWPE